MPGAPSAAAGPGVLGECIYFVPLALGMSRAIPREAIPALGGHSWQGGLGKETLALDGETQGGGLGRPSCLPPFTL